nr:efflux transporter outer membrane subunit [Dyella sedimenti]
MGAALLAGCASMAPPHQTPPMAVPNAWPGDVQPGAPEGAPRAVQLDWRGYFVDPRLQQLIATALDNNRDLRVAMLRVDEARAAYRIQRSEQFPAIGLGAQGTRARVPGDLNVTGQPVISTDYEFYVGLSSWELDLWGRVRSLKEAALQQYLATDSAQRAVQLTLVAQVANSYLALRELDERLALTRQTIATRQESYRIFSRRHEVGSASKLELTDVQTLLTQAQALGAQLEQERATQAHALAQLVGAPVDLAPDDTRFDDDSVFAPLQVGLPSDLLADRPDIQAAEYRLKAANANIGAARADFFPRIALTGSFGTASAQLDGLFQAGSRSWAFVPSVTLPVFDAGRRQAGLALSEVRRDIAVADYDNTVQNAFREVADALSARQWLVEQVRIQRETVAAQTERARLAKLRYDSGAIPYLEVLDAQRALLSAEQELVRARRALLSSEVSLYAALGGGVSTPAEAGVPHQGP